MGKPSNHPLHRVLHDRQAVFSSRVDCLIHEMNQFIPLHAMWDLLDWNAPPPLEDLERFLICKLEIIRNDYANQTEVMKARRDRLVIQIEEAFADISLGAGVSIGQAHVIDDYGGETEQTQAREVDQEKHWCEVDVDAKDPGGSALTFMDAAGFRFYLPAYMINSLKHGIPRLGEYVNSNSHGSVVWALDSKLAKDQSCYSILSEPQGCCVAKFLMFAWEINDDADSLKALRRNWSQFLSLDSQQALE